MVRKFRTYDESKLGLAVDAPDIAELGELISELVLLDVVRQSADVDLRVSITHYNK